MTGNHYRLTQP